MIIIKMLKKIDLDEVLENNNHTNHENTNSNSKAK